MKKFATIILTVITLTTMIGCKPSKTDVALSEFRNTVMEIKAATDRGVSYDEHSDLINKLSARMTLIKSDLFVRELNDRQKKDLAILLMAATDYATAQLLWTQHLYSDICRQNDIVMVDGEIMPVGVDKIYLRNESNKTMQRVFGKIDYAVQRENKFLLSRSVAFSIFWLHADAALALKVK
jgi:TPP-dependent 2-oxoacid decarboxylase